MLGEKWNEVVAYHCRILQQVCGELLLRLNESNSLCLGFRIMRMLQKSNVPFDKKDVKLVQMKNWLFIWCYCVRTYWCVFVWLLACVCFLDLM